MAKLLLPFGSSPTLSRFSLCTSWFPSTAYLSSWKSRVRFDVLSFLGSQVIAALEVECRHDSRVSVRFRSPKDQTLKHAAGVVTFRFNCVHFR